MRVRFGDFILDTDRRELLRNEEPLHIPPKALQLLQILIENRPRAVAQQELYDRLWPKTFVEKTSLHNLVYQLRETLDDRQRAVIRTAYGFGFSFAATAVDDRPNLPQSLWQVVIGDREFDLREGENIVGRELDAAIRLSAPSISRHHARIIIAGDRATIEDLDSKNGTSVGGKRIRGTHPLADGDAILFGTVAARLRAVRPTPSTETAS
jgi:DNA-binding winged helix-turn-helix (wHTH) protein